MFRWINTKTPHKKRVLLRVDFNVPIQNGKIQDDFRIKAHLPTLKLLLKNKNTIILISQIGQPGGKSNPALSAKPVAKRLSLILEKNVSFIKDPFTKRASDKITGAEPGSVFLLENIRFWKGEEDNKASFAKHLSKLGEVFIQDAFGTIHRKHATFVQLPRFLPAYGGLLLKKELDALKPLTNKPERPFVVIMGGAKISTKIGLIKAFSRKADRVLLGGALANTALASLNFPVGKSPVEKEVMPLVRRIAAKNRKLVLPEDAVVAKSANVRKGTAKSTRDIARNKIIFDIGPRTADNFIRELKRAKTVFWNGPLGLVENKAFGTGTLKVARALGGIRAYKVIGGGDLIAFFHKHRLTSGISHFATGGGSTLALLAEERLPGLEALK